MLSFHSLNGLLNISNSLLFHQHMNTQGLPEKIVECSKLVLSRAEGRLVQSCPESRQGEGRSRLGERSVLRNM